MKALILTDGKAGHENQSKAFARALGCGFDLMPVQFRSKAAKALSYLLDRLGIHTLRLFGTTPPQATDHPSREAPQGTSCQLPTTDYQLVIGTGSGTFYAAKALARRLGVPCGVVLYPRGYRIGTFDCILAPAFDNPPPAPNVIEIPVNLVAADAAFYADGVKAFRERHPDSGRPAVAVIVGGPNKCSTMTAEWMRVQLETIFAAHAPTTKQSNNQTTKQSNNLTTKQSNNLTTKQSNNPSSPEFWVTTSRRTPPEVEAVVDSFPFDYKLLYSRDHFNPIPAFVSLASHLYVTAESTGMLSEACSFGTAQVHVLDNLNPGPHKFRRFAEACAARGSAKADLTMQFAAAKRLLGLAQ